MTRLDLPDKWHDLFSGYALGNLTQAEQTELDQILEEQPELREELRAYESTFAQLPYALESAPLPVDLETRILQEIQVAEHEPDVVRAGGQSWVRPRRRYWLQWGGIAAAALVAALSWNNYQLRRSLTANQQKLTDLKAAIQQLQREKDEAETVLASLQNPEAIYALEGTGKLTDTFGSVVTFNQENRAVLIAHNLPDLPDDEVYRFWAFDAPENALMYCGQFTVDTEALVEWSLPEPTCGLQSQQAVITIDPISSSTASGGELAMQSVFSPDAQP
ncbi:anti-sigma factor [Oscillatoria sp. CS-180]|uniref:anti-sigma factor domain-containing protein n=1 Tax=Oscillatoria sp. CS-180 TaxID=3021720 RepID=UPI00232B0C71|nr:anti-sigma factor [Oscillatoria sp. CS-180]MDB9528696.1 anti-sigma factor [Oscillatoria sp. CS-180]